MITATAIRNKTTGLILCAFLEDKKRYYQLVQSVEWASCETEQGF